MKVLSIVESWLHYVIDAREYDELNLKPRQQEKIRSMHDRWKKHAPLCKQHIVLRGNSMCFESRVAALVRSHIIFERALEQTTETMSPNPPPPPPAPKQQQQLLTSKRITS